MTAIGILGIGTHLPPHVRANDWWPADVVRGWQDRMAHKVTRGEAPTGDVPEGLKRTFGAMAKYANDPFRGAIERRIMGDDMTPSKMEAIAGREALQRAGIRPDQIDAIFCQTPVPEQLLVNGACITHKLLELPQHCIAIQTEVACNAFSHHLTLAHALIASGQARYVLSVHSNAMSRVMRTEEPDSPWMGDGAAGVVIGPVADGHGILGAVHNCDGSSYNGLVLGSPDGRWWEQAGVTIHTVDREHTRAMLITLVDRARDAVAASVAKAGLRPSDVDFYASHQGTVWLADVTKDYAGLTRAKTLTTFPMLGNMSSVNVPFILAMAERDGLIRDGSVVATYTGGIGETWSSVCLRWGR